MTIARPKVVSIGNEHAGAQAALEHHRCRTQPSAAMIGSTRSSPRNGEMPACRRGRTDEKAARTARLPWARLMMRMTPNMKDRPHAIERVIAAEQNALDDRR